MEIFHNLVMGFGVAITPINLLYALIGCLLGTLIGLLPGIGPVATIAMVAFGLLLGIVGTDVNSGVLRFTFNIPELSDGIGFVIVAMGMFGTAEIVANLELKDSREIFTKAVKNLWPTREDFKRAWAPVMRGTALGSFLGILPGGGALLASFGAYTLEKKMWRHPEQFGKGAIAGVSGPE